MPRTPTIMPGMPTPDTNPIADTAATQHAQNYAVFLARDARFDGRLFVGVTSTKIYCRPVCRVRAPLARNCRFYANAAQAEQAGFRPCLRCRPELAPGLSMMDSPRVLAQHAARQIDEAVPTGGELYMPDIAQRLGVTDRHLRRIFAAEFGVSPLDYLSTQRLLLAKQLLTDTALPITEVAHASGFASLRRFNAAFLQRYRMNPTALRKNGSDAQPPGAEPKTATTIVLRLSYRPPYDLLGVMRYFSDRAVPGVEAVDGLCYQRSLALSQGTLHATGWFAARFVPERNELQVQVSASLAPLVGSLTQRLRQGLDLDADPALIAPTLALLNLPERAGVRVPGGVDGFETAARVILGQQVTVAAARTLTRRLVEAFGEPINTPFASITRLFPSAQAMAAASAETIGKLGIVRQRVGALQALAHAVADGRIVLNRGAPLQATMDALHALPGIGEWTVQLIAMRALAWPDAFAASDIGLLNALHTRDIKAVSQQAQAWRPWRAYALMRLWQTLENTP